MALTNVYYSPSGAGSQDGSSAANAKAAITGTSWTTDIEGETRQNTRWIFLAGTYTVNEELVPTSTDPTQTIHTSGLVQMRTVIFLNQSGLTIRSHILIPPTIQRLSERTTAQFLMLLESERFTNVCI